MADNFNLRTFLTENKLTKNAQLLNEEVSLNGKPVDVRSIEIDGIDMNDYPDFVDAYIIAADYEDGTPLSDDEVQQFQDENYDLVGELIHDRQLYLEGDGEEEGTLNEDNLEVKKAARDLYTFLKSNGVTTTLGSNMGFGKKIGMKTPGQAEASIFYGETGNSGGQTLINISLRGMEDKVKEVENKFLTAFPNLEIVNGSKKVYSILSGDMTNPGAPIPGAVNQNFTVKEKTTAKGGLAGNTQQNVKENTMTQRDKYLTRLVENALGLQVTEDDNVDYTMGRHDDPNQLPNPAPELNIPEGDEMADETVIPEYHSIDELMKSIDEGTNEVAEKHKMEQMKKIAEALRMKAKKMEESEHAAHISPKDLKQLATDAAKLEKAAEKLKSAFDKKFNKKEKPAAAPKAEKVEALQEGTFDLRKFLVENKLTAGSRMVNENTDIQQAFSEAGLTGMVTVLFQSDSSMGEPDIATMPAERALKLVASKAANAESVIVVQANEITQGEQIGDYEEETEGLTCKLIVEILDEGAYEIWQ